MALFDFFRAKPSKGKFVTASRFKKNKDRQLQMTPQTLNQLRKLDISSTDKLKLEFFFYTNSVNKASQLAEDIEKLNYTVQHGASAGDKKLFIISGWTTKMEMSSSIVLEWTRKMCELGYSHDCEFDGWGTDPSQS